MASPCVGWCHQRPYGNGLEHMKKLLLILGLLLSLTTGALAQNPTCPTRPVGDTSNACASTAFVQNQFATTIALGLNIGNASPTFPSGFNVTSIGAGAGGDWIASFERQGTAAN